LIIQANDLLIQANRLRDPPRLTLFDSDQNSVLFVLIHIKKAWIKRRFICLLFFAVFRQLSKFTAIRRALSRVSNLAADSQWHLAIYRERERVGSR
jgi:hypothetical protein